MSDNDDVNTSGGTYVGDSVTAGRDFVGRDKFELNFPPLSDSTLEELLRSLLPQTPNHVLNKEALFTHHIEPTFQKLEQVHKDYEKVFLALHRQIKTGKVNYRSLQDWLEERSILFRTERTYLKNIDKEMDAVVAKVTESSEHEKLRKLIGEFSQSIIDFFRWPSSSSLYSGIISELTLVNWTNSISQTSKKDTLFLYIRNVVSFFRFSREKRNNSEESNQPDINIKLNHWLRVVLRDLPIKWENITQVYLKLRGMCLT